jgi:dolichyl-diphosphooligosaccharide--protein glycosyltransferase
LAEVRESPPRPFLSRLRRGDGRPSELRKWFAANWTTLFMLLFIFILALFVRSYFGYEMASKNGWLVSGGSDSYYWERIIDYSAHTGKQLYYDPLLNFPDGIRNPRPPFFSMSIAVPAVIAQDLFHSLDDSLGFTLLWSTAFWGALTVVPTYFLGKETFGRRAGLAAAFFLAIMPSHVQRSVLSDADHDSFILFFIVLTFYFMLKAVKTQDHRRWVDSWRSWGSIKSGFKDYFKNSRTPVMYAAMAGVSYGAVIMAWVGFGYASVLILVYYVIQILMNKLRNADSMSVTIIVAITMGLGFLLSFPVYYEQSLIPVRFDVPVYLFVVAIVFGMLFVVSRDYPWTITFPAIFALIAIGVLTINIFDPALAQAIISGQGYFVQNKLYSTIAEARAPKFSELALGFGMVTFFMSLIGLIWALMKVPKKATTEYIFIVVWLAAAIFMAISAGRFMFNAAPAFAISCGWVLVVIVDKLDFNSVRKSLMGASGSYLRVMRKSIKVRHIVGALFLAFLVVLPNVWYGVDAGIPSERKASLDKQIYNSLPTFMRPSGYDKYNGSAWYLGAFGYSLPLPSYYFPAAWSWFAEQDSDVLPDSMKPAYVSWWDYGFEAIREGKHPTVADNFQNGYQLTGNVIMAQGETDAIAIFAYRIVQGGVDQGPEMEAKVFDLFEEYGVSETRMQQIIHGPGQQIIDEVLADPLTYGPMDQALSDTNARIVAARVELAKLGDQMLVSLYSDLCDLTGRSIRYFSVDSRMFPRSGEDTGIFYAPAKLSDRRIIRGSTPIDFFDIQAVDQYGAAHDFADVTSDMIIQGYKIVYKDMFYNSMFYSAIAGYSGADIGGTNDGIPGLTSPTLQNQNSAPGWNLTHFKMVYRTAYYNPFPSAEVYLHRDAWSAISLEQAADFRAKIESGAMTGVIDDSAGSLYSAGAVFLEYYEGALVNGTVTDEQGNPVANVRVTIQDEFGIPHGSEFTDANGQYSLLAPFGNVTLVFSTGKASNVGLTGSNVLTRLQFNVTDDQAMRLPYDLDNDGVLDYIFTKDFKMRGTEATADIFWDNDGDGNYTQGTDELIPDVVVKASDMVTDRTYTINATDGTYDVFLPPGRYRFNAIIQGANLTMVSDTNITAGQKDTEKLAVQPSKVSVLVVDDEGQPARGTTLVLTDLSTGYQRAGATDLDGNLTFDKVLAGYYSLVAAEQDRMLFNALFNPTPGQTAKANLTLHEASTIDVRAFANGAPAAYAVFMATDVYDPMSVTTGIADAWGMMEIKVPRGLWNVYVNYFDGEKYYAGATLFDTSESSAVSGTASLVPAALVSGTLRGPQFVPVQKSFVTFEWASGAVLPVATDTSGSFNIRLPAGNYKVTAQSPSASGFLSQTIEVPDGDSNFQLRMSTGAKLTGRVWMDRDSVSGVSAIDIGTFAQLKITDSFSRSFRLTADIEGSFVAVVPKGTEVGLTLGNPGYRSWSESTTYPSDNSAVSIVASPDAVTVSGKVTSQGVGVRGVRIAFLPSSPYLMPVYATSGGDGEYSASVPPAIYTVSVAQDASPSGGERYLYSATEVIAPSGVQLSMDITVQKKVLVFGNVLGASTPQTLKFDGPETTQLTLTTLNYSQFLLPGTYKVYATGMTGSVHYASMTTEVVSATSRQHDLDLVKAHALSGTVMYGSSHATKAVSVTAVSSTGERLTQQSDSLGRYSVDLPPGDYSLSYVLEDTKLVGGVTIYTEHFADEQVTITTGDVTLDPALQDRLDNATITGTVLGTDGTPQQAIVSLIMNSLYGMNATFSTSSDGTFTGTVQPGDYTVYVTRPQDKSAYLSTLHIARNSVNDQTLDLTPGRFLSGAVTASGAGLSVEVSITSGNAKLELQSASDGSFSVLVPEGNYTLGAVASVVERGKTIVYSRMANAVVGATDVYTDMSLLRDTKRSVAASWNRTLTQTAPPGVTVTYTFTVENTGNTADLFLITFVGSGFDVKFTPSEVQIDFGFDNETTIVAEVTAKSTTPTGDTRVSCLVRSRTLGSARADIGLYLNVAAARSVLVTSLNTSQPVTSASTVTKFRLNNTGNIADTYTVEVANAQTLAAMGWSVDIVNETTMQPVSEVSIPAFGHVDLLVNFTATRTNPDPTAAAAVIATSSSQSGVSDYGSVPVLLPDLAIGPGDVDVVRGDVTYEADKGAVYLDIGLAISLAVLVFMFFYLRRKKGFGGSGGAKK